MDFIVSFDNKNLRLDVYAAQTTGLTRSRVKALIDGGAITLNGKTVKCGAILKEGDRMRAEIPETPKPSELKPENIPVKIVYEDGDIAVIDKSRGLTVHPAGGNCSGTLVNALLYHLNSLSGKTTQGDGGSVWFYVHENHTLPPSPCVIRPGIVHRLDKLTTGLMVVAKNDAAHLSLSKQIAEKSAERIYRGIAEGVVKYDAGVIDQPLGRDPKDRKKITVRTGGRHAVTHWRVLKRYAQNTLMEFKLETGRTHQIRVHMKHFGHPLLGDREYGFKKQRLDLPGQMLHAYKLSFNHPVTGERLVFTAEPPEDFLKVTEKLKRE